MCHSALALRVLCTHRYNVTDVKTDRVPEMSPWWRDDHKNHVRGGGPF